MIVQKITIRWLVSGKSAMVPEYPDFTPGQKVVLSRPDGYLRGQVGRKSNRISNFEFGGETMQ